jgi:putative transcriptional regulator
MSKIATIGKRYLKDGAWHDDQGLIAGSPAQWAVPMTLEEVEMAALSDPDSQPATAEQLARMAAVPFVTRLRRKLAISQAEFAERYRIPLGTLRDWEQNRATPDAAAAAYLTVIAAHPITTAEALVVASKLEMQSGPRDQR